MFPFLYELISLKLCATLKISAPMQPEIMAAVEAILGMI
jgi:hypothetical protein